MPAGELNWQLAECLLPGLTEEKAVAFAARLNAEITDWTGPEVALLGYLLVPGDELLMCLFAGSESSLRALAGQANLPVYRIVECVPLGWQPERGRYGRTSPPCRSPGDE